MAAMMRIAVKKTTHFIFDCFMLNWFLYEWEGGSITRVCMYNAERRVFRCGLVENLTCVGWVSVQVSNARSIRLIVIILVQTTILCIVSHEYGPSEEGVEYNSTRWVDKYCIGPDTVSHNNRLIVHRLKNRRTRWIKMMWGYFHAFLTSFIHMGNYQSITAWLHH